MTCAFELIEQGNRFIHIDAEGKDHEVSKELALAKVLERKDVVKVEGLEQFFGEIGSVHSFISPKGGISFPYHTDEVDLIIRCVEGTKNMIIEGASVRLSVGGELFIAQGVEHMAVNNTDSVILSIEQCKYP